MTAYLLENVEIWGDSFSVYSWCLRNVLRVFFSRWVQGPLWSIFALRVYEKFLKLKHSTRK